MAVENDALDRPLERLAAFKEEQFWAEETRRRTAESERVMQERESELYKLTWLVLQELRAIRAEMRAET